MKKHKINTWLPVFPGFYGTIFEADESNEIENINSERKTKGLNKIDSDLIKFDYDSYNEKICKDCTNFIESELKKLNLVESIKFETLASPKEYNFRNDSINIEVELTYLNIKSIRKYIKDNWKAFAGYIKDNYTSRSGFWSHYSNCAIDWIIEWNETIVHEHKLGAILNFICENEEITDETLYYACEAYLSAENYTDCTEKNYCVKCESFKDNFEGNLCTDCFEEEQDEIASGNVTEKTKFYCCKCKSLIENKWANRSIIWNIKLGNLKYSEVNCGCL